MTTAETELSKKFLNTQAEVIELKRQNEHLFRALAEMNRRLRKLEVFAEAQCIAREAGKS